MCCANLCKSYIRAAGRLLMLSRAYLAALQRAIAQDILPLPESCKQVYQCLPNTLYAHLSLCCVKHPTSARIWQALCGGLATSQRSVCFHHAVR
jgi:hypothetical protein